MVALMVLGLNLRTKPAVATSSAITIFTGIVESIDYIATGFNQFSSTPPLVVGSVL